MLFEVDVDYLDNPDLTEEEKKIIRYYIDEGNKDITTFFYEGEGGLLERLKKRFLPAELKKEIDTIKHKITILDRAINRNYLKKDYIVYRGMRNTERKLIQQKKIGEIFIKTGFLSVSYCHEVALRDDFTIVDKNGELNIMIMEIKKNDPGLFVGNVPEFWECEIILPKEKQLQLIAKSSRMIKDLNLRGNNHNDTTGTTQVNIFTVSDKI
jgi:ADP-ribosyltransferase exoenzyme